MYITAKVTQKALFVLTLGIVCAGGLVSSAIAAPAQAGAGGEPMDPAERTVILKAMADELKRSQGELKLEDYEHPYFIAYRIVDARSVRVQARFGALLEDEDDRRRRVAVDVRVGSYDFDSSLKANDFDLFGEPAAFEPSQDAPIEGSAAILRATLWLLTDVAYKNALSNFLKKRAQKVSEIDDRKVGSLSKAEAIKHRDTPLKLETDRAGWADLARRLSAKFKADPKLLEGAVRIEGTLWRVYLVNSEGTEIVKDQRLYTVAFEAITRAPDGMLLEQGRTHYSREWSTLPDEATLFAQVDEALKNLEALRNAPVADPYTGPAILEPQATGVFFHETLGHRLEGERQSDEEEGRTFQGQLGTRILPTFISVRDDPTVKSIGSLPLNGYYTHDDQGVPSRNVVLVQDGVLKTFLTSRTPVEGAPESNGHGRTQSTRSPMARMGNLIVESSRRVPRKKLTDMLVKAARKQGKPYGLVIRDITGGSTNTSNYGYQAFKGSPRLVYRVDARTGEETLVRGVEMVGTPLTAMNKILAASEEMDAFNGFCGAESGYVPVSAVAPAMLFEEIELQRTQKDKGRSPLLPPPWTAEK